MRYYSRPVPGRPWEDLVSEGRELLAADGSVSWRWADLALEVAPVGDSTAHTGSHDALREWADAIGWFAEREFGTLLKYRETAARWPLGTRVPRAGFAIHRVLRSHPDRFTLVKQCPTYREAAKLARVTAILDDRAEQSAQAAEALLELGRLRRTLSKITTDVAEAARQDELTDSERDKIAEEAARIAKKAQALERAARNTRDRYVVATEPLTRILRDYMERWHAEHAASDFQERDHGRFSGSHAYGPIAALAEQTGIPQSSLYNITGGSTQYTELRVVDQILTALGRIDLLHAEMEVLPNPLLRGSLRAA